MHQVSPTYELPKQPVQSSGMNAGPPCELLARGKGPSAEAVESATGLPSGLERHAAPTIDPTAGPNSHTQRKRVRLTVSPSHDAA